jgi:hypothetical protein
VCGDNPRVTGRIFESGDREAVDLESGFERARLVDGDDVVERWGELGVAHLLLKDRERVVRECGGDEANLAKDAQGRNHISGCDGSRRMVCRSQGTASAGSSTDARWAVVAKAAAPTSPKL